MIAIGSPNELKLPWVPILWHVLNPTFNDANICDIIHLHILQFKRAHLEDKRSIFYQFKNEHVDNSEKWLMDVASTVHCETALAFLLAYFQDAICNEQTWQKLGDWFKVCIHFVIFHHLQASKDPTILVSMFPVALPAWTPKDVVELLIAHFRVMLYHEIIVMVNKKVVGGHKSIDSNQSISSTSGSVISGTSITSGGHFNDIDSIALSIASSPITLMMLQHAKNSSENNKVHHYPLIFLYDILISVSKGTNILYSFSHMHTK